MCLTLGGANSRQIISSYGGSGSRRGSSMLGGGGSCGSGGSRGGGGSHGGGGVYTVVWAGSVALNIPSWSLCLLWLFAQAVSLMMVGWLSPKAAFFFLLMLNKQEKKYFPFVE